MLDKINRVVIVIMAVVLTTMMFGGGCVSVPTLDNRHNIAEINSYVNSFPYKSDMEQFGVEDYWQTPHEFLDVNKAGDCEDYAIAKAYLLLSSGMVDASRMKIVLLSPVYPIISGHAVLLIDDKWVLDNLDKEIYPITELRQHWILRGYVNYVDFIKTGGSKSNAVQLMRPYKE